MIVKDFIYVMYVSVKELFSSSIHVPTVNVHTADITFRGQLHESEPAGSEESFEKLALVSGFEPSTQRSRASTLPVTPLASPSDFTNFVYL
jgi:hypothetical protein